MKVIVKPDLCCGAQLCADVAGEFYSLVDGFNALVGALGPTVVPADMEEAAQRGAQACPECAIIIIADEG
jgi:ferredoxin